jgi:uncharacterized protein (TIGR03435 family)
LRTLTIISLRLVIAALYSDDHRLADRVDGGPKWINTDAYDIEGQGLEGPPSQDTLKAMARSLLEDR